MLLAVVATVFVVAGVWWATPRDGLDLWTVLEDASGMKAGKPVTMAGVQIGEVRRLTLTDDDRVRVDFRVDREHAHRMRGARDAAACKGDAKRPQADVECGTTVESALMPTLSTLLAPRGLIVHAGRGRPLTDGELVPCEEREGLDTLLETLGDERIVRDLPMEVGKLLPALRRLTVSLTELSEGLQTRSPVRGLLGGKREDDVDRKDRKDRKKD